MKTLLSLAFLMVCTITFAQGTTQEEYNYVTKGYKIQQESGLDMKKGYSIKNYPVKIDGVVSSSNGFRTETQKILVQSAGLYREAEPKPCAIIITYQNFNKNSVEYFCIPTFNAPYVLWEAHYQRMREYANDAKSVIYECVTTTLAYFAKE